MACFYFKPNTWCWRAIRTITHRKASLTRSGSPCADLVYDTNFEIVTMLASSGTLTSKPAPRRLVDVARPLRKTLTWLQKELNQLFFIKSPLICTRLPNKWTEIPGAGAAQSANMLAKTSGPQPQPFWYFSFRQNQKVKR